MVVTNSGVPLWEARMSMVTALTLTVSFCRTAKNLTGLILMANLVMSTGLVNGKWGSSAFGFVCSVFGCLAHVLGFRQQTDNPVVEYEQVDCPGAAATDWAQCICYPKSVHSTLSQTTPKPPASTTTSTSEKNPTSSSTPPSAASGKASLVRVLTLLNP
jgi:hypothetical protein